MLDAFIKLFGSKELACKKFEMESDISLFGYIFGLSAVHGVIPRHKRARADNTVWYFDKETYEDVLTDDRIKNLTSETTLQVCISLWIDDPDTQIVVGNLTIENDNGLLAFTVPRAFSPELMAERFFRFVVVDSVKNRLTWYDKSKKEIQLYMTKDTMSLYFSEEELEFLGFFRDFIYLALSDISMENIKKFGEFLEKLVVDERKELIDLGFPCHGIFPFHTLDNANHPLMYSHIVEGDVSKLSEASCETYYRIAIPFAECPSDEKIRKLVAEGNVLS